MTRDDVLSLLAAHRQVFEAHGVRAVLLFGSVARGEAGPGSDIDLLLDFARPIGLFEFVALKNELERVLGRRVDLVTRAALKEQLRERILAEAIHAA
jgi:predicted nucleotidyltransferase